MWSKRLIKSSSSLSHSLSHSLYISSPPFKSKSLPFTIYRSYLFPLSSLSPFLPLSSSSSTFSSLSPSSSVASLADTVVRDVGLLAQEHYIARKALEDLEKNNRRKGKQGKDNQIIEEGVEGQVGEEKIELPRGIDLTNSKPYWSCRWHLIDAKDQIVGRLAAQIATVLRGKHKAVYSPSRNAGDYVVVINAKELVFTGRKMKDKKYYWHTLHPGGLKSRTPKDYVEKGNPEEILRHAVLGMLPKNSLRNEAIKKLRIFPDKYHIYDKQLKGKENILK